MTNVLKYSLAAALALAFLAGCGDSKPADGGGKGGGPTGGGGGGGGGDTTPDAPANLPDAATVGTIKVTVKLKSAPPKRNEIPMSDETCSGMHKEAPLDETVVAANGLLQNAAVWIESGLDAKYSFPAPTTPVTIDQKGCVYVPHVLSMQAKQPLEVKNSDGVKHNIHSKSKSNEFNMSQDAHSAMTLTTTSKPNRTFTAAEAAFKVQCDIHGWMGAWVLVFKHPFHGVSGADGVVTLKGVPPGTYKIHVWSEKYGDKTVEVTLKEKGAEETAVEFE